LFVGLPPYTNKIFSSKLSPTPPTPEAQSGDQLQRENKTKNQPVPLIPRKKFIPLPKLPTFPPKQEKHLHRSITELANKTTSSSHYGSLFRTEVKESAGNRKRTEEIFQNKFRTDKWIPERSLPAYKGEEQSGPASVQTRAECVPASVQTRAERVASVQTRAEWAECVLFHSYVRDNYRKRTAQPIRHKRNNLENNYWTKQWPAVKQRKHDW